jgi:hypothetical protein
LSISNRITYFAIAHPTNSFTLRAEKSTENMAIREEHGDKGLEAIVRFVFFELQRDDERQVLQSLPSRKARSIPVQEQR